LLPIYYKRLFPYGPYFKWLNYGGGAFWMYRKIITGTWWNVGPPPIFVFYCHNFLNFCSFAGHSVHHSITFWWTCWISPYIDLSTLKFITNNTIFSSNLMFSLSLITAWPVCHWYIYIYLVPGRFAPLNCYYIIIDEVFFKKILVIIYSGAPIIGNID
jgi:hypothetical protein